MGHPLAGEGRPHLSSSAPMYRESPPAPSTAKKSLHLDLELMHLVTLSPLRIVIYSRFFPFSIEVEWFQSLEVSLKVKEISNTVRIRSWLQMASNNSSSSGLSVEGRIASLETSMGRLRGRLDSQDKKLEEASQAGNNSWDLLNEDIRKLREDQAASAERMEDFKDEVRTGFKDASNTHGDFGKRINDLETVVAKLAAKLNK